MRVYKGHFICSGDILSYGGLVHDALLLVVVLVMVFAILSMSRHHECGFGALT